MSISARNSRRGHALLLGAALVLGGCTVGPDFSAPNSASVSRYTAGGDPKATANAAGLAQQFDTSANLPADWWRLLGSSDLNDAVRQGLTASPTIAGAEANLRQAQDNLRSGEGVFWPQAGFDATAAREQPSANATPARISQGTFNLSTLSASVSYALDLFGGEKRGVEALGADVDYQRNAARAAALTLASNIANTLIAVAAYHAEIQAVDDIVTLEKQEVQLAGVQATAGTAAYAAQLSLQSQLDGTEAALPALHQKLSQAQDLLAVLEGKLPSEMALPAVDFDNLSLPQTLPVSLPSALVKDRPDILEAQATLHVASAEIGVATAAMLPNITLGGEFGFSSVSPASLFSSSLWSLGAGLTQPMFDGGTLWYRREAAKDAFDVSSSAYRQTVLAAFQQVADTLQGLAHDADILAADDQALATAERAQKLVQSNYAAGLTDYSQVLIANTQYRQARIDDIEAKAIRFQDTVALFAALGGGWWNQMDDTMASAETNF